VVADPRSAWATARPPSASREAGRSVSAGRRIAPLRTVARWRMADQPRDVRHRVLNALDIRGRHPASDRACGAGPNLSSGPTSAATSASGRFTASKVGTEVGTRSGGERAAVARTSAEWAQAQNVHSDPFRSRLRSRLRTERAGVVTSRTCHRARTGSAKRVHWLYRRGIPRRSSRPPVPDNKNHHFLPQFHLRNFGVLAQA
jgi:hypothetical protein